MQIRRSIQKKFMSVLLIIVICSMLISAVVTEISMSVMKKTSEDSLVSSTLNSATEYAKGKVSTVDSQIKEYITQIEEAAYFAEYTYAHPEHFSPVYVNEIHSYIGQPGIENRTTFHYGTFESGEEENPEILEELKTISAFEPYFETLRSEYPNITSLYVATESHINIGYDETVSLKFDFHGYNPETLEKDWYVNPMTSGETFMSNAYDDTFGRGLMMTVSAPYKVNGKIHGVIGADISIEYLSDYILNTETSIEGGYHMLLNGDGNICCFAGMNAGDSALSKLGSNGQLIMDRIMNGESGFELTDIDGKKMYVVFDNSSELGLKLLVFLPVESIMEPTNELSAFISQTNVVMILLSCAVLAVAIFIGIALSKKTTKPIVDLADKIGAIHGDSIDYVSEVHTGDEVELLSVKFEGVVIHLKEYIERLMIVTAEKERVSAELDVAKHIQASMLPCIFPPFPERREIEIYATMSPAKEVGGDFYDFFFVDNTHLAIVMADVSGKGVPAALFMVIGKTLIKDHTTSGIDLGEVFEIVNNMLCESNSEEMFITAFAGVLDLTNGEFCYVNAGHETPFICKKDGTFESLEVKPGFVLAGLEDMKYQSYKTTFEPGTKIFQYTDGVPEATNANEELFGMQRLADVLTSASDKSPEEILPIVRAKVDEFVGDAPQFDDLSMLCLEFKEYTVQ